MPGAEARENVHVSSSHSSKRTVFIHLTFSINKYTEKRFTVLDFTIFITFPSPSHILFSLQ